MPSPDEIRSELARLGANYQEAQRNVANVESELAEWLALARGSGEITISEAAALAKLSSRPLAYKILRRAGSGRR